MIWKPGSREDETPLLGHAALLRPRERCSAPGRSLTAGKLHERAEGVLSPGKFLKDQISGL